MDNTEKLSILEQKLVDRELKFIQENVQKGLDLIIKAFKPYYDTSYGNQGVPTSMKTGDTPHHASSAQMAQYVESLFPASYYSGYRISVATSPPPVLPRFLLDAILKKAVADHLANVDRLLEVSQES